MDDPVAVYLSDVFTVLANLVGIPAVSIPVKTEKELPAGIQVIGKKFEEAQLLHFSKIIK